MAKVTIETLKAMSDDDLLEKMGAKQKLEKFKENLEEASKLEGKAKENIEDRLERMFNPTIYVDDLSWDIKHAKRAAKSGKEEACCCDPCSVID